MSTLENLVDIPSTPQFQELLSKDLKRISLIYFWTSWAEPCVQMNQVVEGLAKAYPTLLALRASTRDPIRHHEIDNMTPGGGRRAGGYIRLL